ncbi:MAG: GIY-YIG nuclease family protein [Rhodobacteraceae bacterium]|nr:GIY-YIG nuclease family protein [Paracoccaceae bacterium]
MITKGRSLELFIIDGRPDGMLTAEVFNWTGHVLREPRTQLKQALQRPEAGYTGVYALLGIRDGEPLAYIGETEDLSLRLRAHAANKDWWETAILISSTANNLHKAHVKYLEARLVEIARSVGATPLENGNTPPRSSLSEAAISNMEAFLETLQMVLPAIRVDMFLNKTRESAPLSLPHNAGEPAIQFELKTPKHGIEARALLENGEMVVQRGSAAQSTWKSRSQHNAGYAQLHSDLIASGVLAANGALAKFTIDYAFSSPSAAAAIINGRAANGRTEWKLKADGRSFAQWEADQLKHDEA